MELQYAPIGLRRELPICGAQPFVQRDRPITFLHVHDCLELGYCYRGGGVFVVADKILPFRAGDVSFINHTEAHLACSAPGTDSDWTWIYLDPIALAGAMGEDLSLLDPTPLAGPGFRNLIRADESPEIGRIVLRMVDELRQQLPGRSGVLRALACELMMLMHRRGAGARRRRSVTQPYDRLAPAMQYLALRYADPIDISSLAKRCGLSEPHFRRTFHRVVGRSPREYWHDLRMRMAASLLRTTSRPILQISLDVGFDTLSSFNRVFRSTFRTTPRAWRRVGGTGTRRG